jgi:hypothetical protein
MTNSEETQGTMDIDTKQQVETLEQILEQTKDMDKLDPETQLEHSKKIAGMEFKAMTTLVAAHIRNFGATMVSNNNVSYKEKLLALKALENGITQALEFGTQPGVELKLPKPGVKWSKETKNFVHVLIKANELKTLLLAYNYKEGEENVREQTESTGIQSSGTEGGTTSVESSTETNSQAGE